MYLWKINLQYKDLRPYFVKSSVTTEFLTQSSLPINHNSLFNRSLSDLKCFTCKHQFCQNKTNKQKVPLWTCVWIKKSVLELPEPQSSPLTLSSPAPGRFTCRVEVSSQPSSVVHRVAIALDLHFKPKDNKLGHGKVQPACSLPSVPHPLITWWWALAGWHNHIVALWKCLKVSSSPCSAVNEMSRGAQDIF